MHESMMQSTHASLYNEHKCAPQAYAAIIAGSSPNSSAEAGNTLFLTKPLGVGILTTAGKKGVATPAHRDLARDTMLRPNSVGPTLWPGQLTHLPLVCTYN